MKGETRPPRSAVGATLQATAIDVIAALMVIGQAPIVIRKLGVSGYGLFAFLSVISSQLVPLQLGMPHAVMLRISPMTGSGVGLLRDVLWAGLAVAMGGGVLVGLSAAVAWSSVLVPLVDAAGVPGASAWETSVVVGSLLALQPVTAMLQGLLLGREDYRTLLGLRLVQGVLRPALVIAAMMRDGRFASAVTALLVSEVVVGVASLSALGGAARDFPETTRWTAEVRSLLRVGIPFAVVGVGAALLADSERLLLGSLGSAGALALFALGANAALRLAMLPGAASTFLLPRIARSAAEHRLDLAGETCERWTRLLLLGAAALSAPLIAMMPELLALWVGPGMASAANFSARLVFLGVCISVVGFMALGSLRALARSRVLNLVVWSELTVYAIALTWVVPRFGADGVAVCFLCRMVLETTIYRAIAGVRSPAFVRQTPSLAAALCVLGALTVGSQTLLGEHPEGRGVASVVVLLILVGLLGSRRDLRDLLAFARSRESYRT